MRTAHHCPAARSRGFVCQEHSERLRGASQLRPAATPAGPRCRKRGQPFRSRRCQQRSQIVSAAFTGLRLHPRYCVAPGMYTFGDDSHRASHLTQLTHHLHPWRGGQPAIPACPPRSRLPRRPGAPRTAQAARQTASRDFHPVHTPTYGLTAPMLSSGCSQCAGMSPQLWLELDTRHARAELCRADGSGVPPPGPPRPRRAACSKALGVIPRHARDWIC